jgi:starvation-inducible DNA-binding protein
MENLNILLKNLIILSLKVKNYHWNVIDANFFSIHKQLDEIHGLLLNQIDDLAEVIRSSGVFINTDLKDYINNTQLNSMVNPGSSAKIIIKNLSSDYIMLISQIKNIITPTNIDSMVISDFCIQLLGSFQKTLWMLESSIVENIKT